MPWALVAAAGGILLLNMGARQSLGLFIAPIDATRPVDLVGISFAFAVSQLVWGAVQPVFGALVERWGTFRIIVLGAALVAIGTAATPYVQSSAGLSLTLGVLAAAGAGAGSFSILIGWLARHVPDERRALASGVINAGSSLGQFVFAPLTQWLIETWGWVHALHVLAASALAVIPLAWLLARGTARVALPAAPAGEITHLGAQLRVAFRDRSYLLVHAGFFTCGFHIGFLTTHLPGEVALCSLAPTVSARALALIGLFNIAGSVIAGWLCQRHRMKHVLAAMYASRAVLIVAYLFAPKTPFTFYAFAAALGFTWLATVPPTAGLVGKLFGTRFLATLFGLALFSHQVGGFFGAWLGGVTMSRYGDYTWMWYADAVLALLAAAANLPIREAPLARPLVRAT
ncbi:MAG: MFS transporter [Gammaproteobacteria bacterium]